MKRRSSSVLAGVLGRFVRFGWRAYRLWDRNDCLDLSAAFAYHSLQSLFPILLIALGLASRILGSEEGLTERILEFADRFLPASAEPTVQLTLLKLYRQGTGAGVIGLGFLLLTASNAYLTLQRGTDRLWGLRSSEPQGLPWQASVANFLRVRIEAFSLLLLVALITALDQLTTSFRMLDPGTWRAALMKQMPVAFHPFLPVSPALDFTLSLVASCFLAFVLLRLLPSRPVPHRPLMAGALLIGTSLTGLNIALGRSLISLGARFQAYGIIGGFLVLTLWVLVVGVVLYYGVALSVVVNQTSVVGRSAPQ